MCRCDDPSGNPRLGQNILSISSLNEARLHTLDRWVSDSFLSQAILTLMHNCFFGKAMHAVFFTAVGAAVVKGEDVGCPTGSCRKLPVSGQSSGRAFCLYAKETDWCSGFKLRS